MQIAAPGFSLSPVVLPGRPDSESLPVGTPKAENPEDSKRVQQEDTLELSPDAQREVDKLKARDQQVRAHEAAHMAAGGSLVRGGASYGYKQGPDGKQYAVGGEVSIDTSPVPGNPRATQTKARQIQAAALAPADPSPQDRKVASQAAQMAAQASVEQAKQARETGGSLNLVV